jgi:8-oxo-dGTP diphosphatase
MENNKRSHKLFKINQHAIIQNNLGEILILKKDGKWMLPGGRLEEGEGWLDGLKREIKEETGIEKFLVLDVLGVDISDSKNTYIVIFYGKIDDKPNIVLSPEHEDYAWVGANTIDNYQFFYESVKEKIKNACSYGK